MNEMMRIEIQAPMKYQKILGAKIIEGEVEYYLGEYLGIAHEKDNLMETNDGVIACIDYWLPMPELPTDGLPL